MSEETLPAETTGPTSEVKDNPDDRFSDIDLNTSLEESSPRFDPLTTDQGKQQMNREDEPTLEFFGSDGGGGGGEGSGTDSNPSPKQDKQREKDEETISNGYVTVSPPLTPATDDVDSALLESLDEDSASIDYTEIPKPKPSPQEASYTQQHTTKKMLDFESPIAGPGKSRNLGALMEEIGQDVDLKVDITERKEKMGPKTDIYVTYKICTDSTRPSHLFEEPHYEVWRRYRDFEWLREMIEKNHPTLIIPPLPGKQITRYFDYKSDEFLDERQKALDRFLKRLTFHPYFSFDSTLKNFLTFGNEEFSAHVTETSGSSKLLGVVTSSMKQATTAFMLKNADPFYAEESKYLSDLGEKFGTLERIATRIHSEREELVTAKEDMSSAMIHWAALEPQLEQSLRKFGSCIENCTSALKALNSANAYSVLLTAKEYQLFCASGVCAIRRRDALQLEKERTTDDREKKKKIHDEAATANKLQKLPKLADELQMSSVTADKALDDLTKANEELRVDIEKWREAKNRDVTGFVKQFSNNHVDYHQRCFDEWENVLKLLKIPQLTDLELESSNSDSLLSTSTPTLQRPRTEEDKEQTEEDPSPKETCRVTEQDQEERKKDEDVGISKHEDDDSAPPAVVSQTPGLFDNEDKLDTDLFTDQSS